jgi:uncharacterized protein YdiU (UPF0061 family)
LAQLATSLLPLIPDQPAAIERLTAIINGFADQFNHAWHGVLRAKLGMQEPQDGDISLAFDLLDLMARERADFTRVFRALSGPSPGRARAEFATPAAFDTWFDRWAERMAHQDLPDAARRGAMQAVNPARIPRNHQVEQVITAALAGDMAPFARLNAALAAPFDDAPDFADYEDAPTDATRVRHTFCGT